MTSFKDIVSSAMPFLGSLVGGPIGSQAGALLSNLITGKTNSSEDEIQSKLLTLEPDKLIELKKIDEQYKSTLIKTQFETEKLYFTDMDNARNLQVKAYDHELSKEAPIIDLVFSRIPAVLALFALASLILVILVLLSIEQITQDKKDIIEIMLGLLGALCSQSFNYWLGTTRSSQEKTKILSAASNKK